MFQVFRIPIDILIQFEKTWFNFLNVYKPSWDRVIKQRRITTPTVRITVCKLLTIEEKSTIFQISLNQFFCFLKIFSFYKFWTVFIKVSLRIQNRNHWEINLQSKIEVIFSVNNGRVNNTCSVFCCDEICNRNVMRLFSRFFNRRQNVKRLVFSSFEFTSFKLVYNLYVCSQNLIQQIFRKNKMLFALFCKNICHVSSYSERNVPWQCPRGCCPRKN